jgi:hypothetical protein
MAGERGERRDGAGPARLDARPVRRSSRAGLPRAGKATPPTSARSYALANALRRRSRTARELPRLAVAVARSPSRLRSDLRARGAIRRSACPSERLSRACGWLTTSGVHRADASPSSIIRRTTRVADKTRRAAARKRQLGGDCPRSSQLPSRHDTTYARGTRTHAAPFYVPIAEVVLRAGLTRWGAQPRCPASPRASIQAKCPDRRQTPGYHSRRGPAARARAPGGGGRPRTPAQAPSTRRYSCHRCSPRCRVPPEPAGLVHRPSHPTVSTAPTHDRGRRRVLVERASTSTS